MIGYYSLTGKILTEKPREILIYQFLFGKTLRLSKSGIYIKSSKNLLKQKKLYKLTFPLFKKPHKRHANIAGWKDAPSDPGDQEQREAVRELWLSICNELVLDAGFIAR